MTSASRRERSGSGASSREPGSVADVLRLILVTEQSLQLFEYLRLQRVRDTDPEHIESALEDARASLRGQHDLDEQLVTVMLEAVDRTRVIEALEVHHVLSKDGLDAEARRFHAEVVAFAESSRIEAPGALGDMRRAGLAEARAEVRDRTVAAGQTAKALGAGAASAGSAILRRGQDRVRRGVQSRLSKEESSDE